MVLMIVKTYVLYKIVQTSHMVVMKIISNTKNSQSLRLLYDSCVDFFSPKNVVSQSEGDLTHTHVLHFAQEFNTVTLLDKQLLIKSFAEFLWPLNRKIFVFAQITVPNCLLLMVSDECLRTFHYIDL